MDRERIGDRERGRETSGNGVVAAAAPGVAAEQAPDCEPEAFEGAVFAECFEGVLGAGGGEAATRRFEGGDADLVEADQEDEGGGGGLL